MALRPDSPQSRSNQLAERSAGQGDAFLREVDDALREDQVYTAIQKYGKPVGALIVAGLRGGGWCGTAEDLRTAEIAGGLGGAARLAAELLARAFALADPAAAPK